MTSLVIPIYNERQNISALVRQAGAALEVIARGHHARIVEVPYIFHEPAAPARPGGNNSGSTP